MSAHGTIELRSYRRVFDLERRIYSVDRLRLNPGGVPVRGVVYFLAILACDLLAGSLPLLGALARELPWYLRDIALPGLGATLLSAIRIEGRTFHLAAYALVRYCTQPRRLAGAERSQAAGALWHPQELLLLPDGSDGRLRRMRYTGPGAVLVCVEHERRGRALELGRSGVARSGLRPAVIVTQAASTGRPARGQVISLRPGARLLVRSAARSGGRGGTGRGGTGRGSTGRGSTGRGSC